MHTHIYLDSSPHVCAFSSPHTHAHTPTHTHTHMRTHLKEQRLPHSIIIGLILSEACAGIRCRKAEVRRRAASGFYQQSITLHSKPPPLFGVNLMAHYPTCHHEKIWRGKKILPDARLPRLSGDEHLPVIDVGFHGCVCVCVHLCMHMWSVYRWSVHTSVCVRTEGDCWFLGKQNYVNSLNNGALKIPLMHTHTHTNTHAHTRTLFVIWHVICENKPQSGHSDEGDSPCLSAARAQCLPH